MTLWLQWCEMSALMIGPLVVILAIRSHRLSLRVVADALSALSVWALAGVPVIVLCAIVEPVGNVLGAVLLATAAALQFTRTHDRAIQICSNVKAPSSISGFRIGTACLVSCGPLMVAMFVVGAHGIAVMLVATVLMLAEFLVSKPALVTRSLGFVLATASAAVLFLGYVPSPGGAVSISHSHHMG